MEYESKFNIFCIFVAMKIHVVSFQVPYPANYGGAIDVYFKLLALQEMGVDVILHTFIYGNAQREPTLESVCKQVYYYQRDTSLKKQFSLLPYIVNSRQSTELLENLCKDDAPILFEGLHTCHLLSHPLLHNRRKAVRMHNIEHEYYRYLSKQSGWGWKSAYYYIESVRLHRYAKILRHADIVYAISEADKLWLEHEFSGIQIVNMPCFFNVDFTTSHPNTQPFVLYHGNLAVEENVIAAKYIMRQIAPLMPQVDFIIAGRSACFDDVPRNVSLVDSPDDFQLNHLISTAAVHLLPTFQPTGIKLKLINTLAKANGVIIANREMLHGHTLGDFCIQADSPAEIVKQIQEHIDTPTPQDVIEKRRNSLRRMRNESMRLLSMLFSNESK